MKLDIQLDRLLKESILFELFSTKKNLLELYLELCPEDRDKGYTVEDISESFGNTLHGTLSFEVGDNYFVITELEHFRENDLLLLTRYALTYLLDYIEDHLEESYENKEMKIPKIKLFVLYTGDKEIKDTYSLRADFFDGDANYPDVEVKVVTPDESEVGGIANQYMLFCQGESRLIKRYDGLVPWEQVFDYVENCIRSGILSEFLQTHQVQVYEVFGLLNDQYLRDKYLYLKAFEEGKDSDSAS